MIRNIPFMKMNGCGNDFVVIDNRDGIMSNLDISRFVQKVCSRRTSLGADGVMFLQHSLAGGDFTMRYFNADGSEGEMCGNGARCICKFAHLLGLAKREMTFETNDGMYHALIVDEHTVQVKFPSVSISTILLDQSYDFGWGVQPYHYAYVGVPHTMIVEDGSWQLDDTELKQRGQTIRNFLRLFPRGTNVNFVELVNRQQIRVRTYERGVEAETLACGSGATASAIIAAMLGHLDLPAAVETRGGILTVGGHFGETMVEEIYLQGKAVVVAKGELLPESWM